MTQALLSSVGGGGGTSSFSPNYAPSAEIKADEMEGLFEHLAEVGEDKQKDDNVFLRPSAISSSPLTSSVDKGMFLKGKLLAEENMTGRGKQESKLTGGRRTAP